MAWFHKGPLRNTTGQSLSGNLLVAGQRSSTAPRPGGWHAHTATDLNALAARGAPADQGQHLDKVKHHVAHCQGMASRQQNLPAATTNGRCASFFKAAARDLGSCLGLGIGRTTSAQAAWRRPDRDAAPNARARSDQQRPDPPSNASLRKADRVVQGLEQVEAQIHSVQELIHDTTTATGSRRQETLRNWMARDREHQAAKAHATLARQHVDQARQAYQHSTQEGQRLTAALRQQRAQQAPHHRPLSGPTVVTPRPVDPAPTRSRTLNQGERAQRALQACTALHQQSLDALRQAQAQEQHAQGHGSTSTAAAALQETLQALRMRCERHQAMRDRAQSLVHQLAAGQPGLNGTAAASSSGEIAPAMAGAPSNPLSADLETTRQLLTDWVAQRTLLRTGLIDARNTLAQAQEAERTAQTRLQEALVQTQGVEPERQALELESTTLNSLAQSLEEPLRQARATQAQQAEALASLQTERTTQLLQHPPGFEPGAGQQALSDALRDLNQRLQTAGVASRASDWPVNDTLEVVCKALSMASGGNATVAAHTLRELTQRDWPDLVPRPGQWFDGSPRTRGVPEPPTSPLEALISQLNDLPCGTELLVRLVCTPENKPAAAQRDAVAVYHQAMRAAAAGHTADTASWMWLQCAALTACHIAHPAEPPTDLSVQQRAAFHGVRNGLTSVAPGSPYDQANRQLLRLSDEWVRNLQGNTPFRTRHAAATVATQVGLATPLRQSNESLLKSCAHLQQALTSQLIQVRKDAQNQGQVADLAAVEPLLQAICLLKHIQKHADRHLRVDQMPIGRQAWRSVDKHTARWIKKEGQSAPIPAALRAEARRLGLPAARPSPAAHPPNTALLTGLQLCLLEMRVKPSTALEAVGILHQQLQPLLGATAPTAPTAPTTTPPRMPTIQEDEEDMAEDERQDRLAQAVQDQGWNDAQQALQASRALQPSLNAFMGNQKDWKPDVVRDWITPVVGVNSSAVTMNHGHSIGVSTSSLSSAISHVAGNAGVLIRLDADLMWTRQQQVRWAKQSRGMELFAGDQRQLQGRAGVTGGLGYALITLPSDDALSVGAVAQWAAGRTRTDTQGVLLRSPNDGERPSSQVKEEFSDMVDTVIGWRGLQDSASNESYSSPLQAILARHAQVSVGTVEQLRTVANHTRSGLSASVSGGGPISPEALPGLSGTVGVGLGLVSERRHETTQFKTQGGSQGFEGSTGNTTHTVSAQMTYAGQLGGNVAPVGAGQAALRGRTSAAMLQLDLHRKQVQSSTTVIRQPNGSLVGEKAREFNNFEAFEKAIRPRWDEWVDRCVRARTWPEELSPADRRLLAAQELEDFMSAAASSVRQGGTVTLNETLEVRPEVCAELSACLAKEELAIAQGDHHQASQFFEARQQLLDGDESYQPYKLKAIVRSQMDSALGLDLGLSLLRKQGASATHEYDSFPKS